MHDLNAYIQALRGPILVTGAAGFVGANLFRKLTAVREHRHAVEALYHLTKTLDATRPVIGNDGWESSATDIIGIHDYDANIDHMRQRYAIRHDGLVGIRCGALCRRVRLCHRPRQSG